MNERRHPLTGQRVLITGATGFLGSALVDHLTAAGAVVRGLARDQRKAARLREKGCEIALGDLTDPPSLLRAAQTCAVVIHCAAATTGGPADSWCANVNGTRAMIEAAAEAGARRFVHISTIGAYGYCYDRDVTEEMPLAPGASPYTITKARAEAVVREIGDARGIEWSIVRAGMIYGAGSSLWTGTAFRLARIRPTPFPGDGSGFTHPIYVDDICALILLLTHHPNAAGEIFNGTPDPAPTWRAYLSAYARLAGHQEWRALPVWPFYVAAGLALLFSPPQSVGRDAPDMLTLLRRRIVYRSAKARERLGWQPQTDLETGAARCVPWLREIGLL